MDDQERRIYDLLHELVGDGGCAGACSESELYREDGQWKLFLCGFMEPWPLGETIEEAERSLREYAAAGFGPGTTT
ncbi:MAG TPA: hypothetical protein VLT88_04365 [Desulfosarcina sp.]|nr:hypothetical protein [Desulfosarcina sp.]